MGKSIAELNRIFHEAETVDRDIFAEQRSNVQLVNGDHYNRQQSKYWTRIRDNKQLTQEQKIRLTKNHIQKITKGYTNNITTQAPGVTILPQNEKELADQKAAELHQAVWADLKHRQKIPKKVREWCKDFIDIGECFVKVFWDPEAGEFLGYEAEVWRDDAGEPIRDHFGNVIPVTDEKGQPVSTGTPKFSGGLVFERHFAFNVLRDANAKSMDESPWLCIRKMVPIAKLKLMVGKDEEKLKYIEASSQDIFTVFNGTTGQFTSSKTDCLVKEFHFRPCAEYPKGYYYITTNSGILFEGEHPGGVFPILYVGFDEVATSARARSIIKTLRPYQAEVNRSASKMAEHQVTLGDDKLLIQAGTKITHGGTLAGVRGIQYTGIAPGIIQGRTGEQYLAYMQSQITEMYQVANYYEDMEEKDTSNLDPYTLLYRSIRNKKRFSMYAEKFEGFLTEVCETSLALAKVYYDESMLIPAIGRREYINIPEFKSAKPIYYQIKVEPQTDDVDTKLGKQLVMNQIIQYVGKDIGPKNVGRILKAMPFVNQDKAFNHLTIDDDNADSDILALDRGDYPPPNFYDDHVNMIERLIHRMKQKDFQLLPPEVQQNYQRKKMEHEQAEAEKQATIKAAQAEFIPVGGALITCDFYVNDPNNPTKTVRAKVPYQSMDWLLKQLETQGAGQEDLSRMQTAGQAEVAQEFLNQVPHTRGNYNTPAPANPGVGGQPNLDRPGWGALMQ